MCNQRIIVLPFKVNAHAFHKKKHTHTHKHHPRRHQSQQSLSIAPRTVSLEEIDDKLLGYQEIPYDDLPNYVGQFVRYFRDRRVFDESAVLLFRWQSRQSLVCTSILYIREETATVRDRKMLGVVFSLAETYWSAGPVVVVIQEQCFSVKIEGVPSSEILLWTLLLSEVE
jgi:hypothetical protein